MVSISNLMMVDKVALITGGRTGIGRALALAFAEAGTNIAVCSRTGRDELEAVASSIRKLGRKAMAIKADVSHKADVDDMVKRTIEELGDIDILINNAAIVVRASTLKAKEADWDKVIDINLKGPFLCSQSVGRLMVEGRKGNIINIASQAGIKSESNRIGYSVSKAGIIMLTRVLARELGPYNIRVNAIAPGDVKTAMLEPSLAIPGFLEGMVDKTPLRRIGETDDIVSAALFLASDAADWITGHTLVVDGGYLA